MESEEKQFIIELIEEYRSLPALWNVSSESYSDRKEREMQKEKLLRKYREKYPEADYKMLSRKLNTLRSNYRRELKRIQNASVNSTGVYYEEEPSLYYFHAMDFIRDEKSNSALSCVCESKPPVKKKKISEEVEIKGDEDELIALAASHLKKISNVNEQISEIWAHKLTQMETHQRLFAEKLINDVMFNGQMGLLNFNSCIVNTFEPE